MQRLRLNYAGSFLRSGSAAVSVHGSGSVFPSKTGQTLDCLLPKAWLLAVELAWLPAVVLAVALALAQAAGWADLQALSKVAGWVVLQVLSKVPACPAVLKADLKVCLNPGSHPASSFRRSSANCYSGPCGIHSRLCRYIHCFLYWEQYQRDSPGLKAGS